MHRGKVENKSTHSDWSHGYRFVLGPVFAPCSKGTLLAPPSRLGHSGPGAKTIKPCRASWVCSITIVFLGKVPQHLLCKQGSKNIALRNMDAAANPPLQYTAKGGLPNLLLRLPSGLWPMGMNTGCPYSHYLRDALVASLSTQLSCCPRAGWMQLRKCPWTITNPLTHGYRIHHLKPHWILSGEKEVKSPW